MVRHGLNTITCSESGTKRGRGRNHMSSGPGTMKGRSLASDDHVAGTWGANYEVAGSKPRQTKEKETEKKGQNGLILRYLKIAYCDVSPLSIDNLRIGTYRQIMRKNLDNPIFDTNVASNFI